MDKDEYNRAYPNFSPLHVMNGSVYGFWLVGNNYRNPTKYYGAYPANFLKRIHALFKEEFTEGEVLHLFSGMVAKLGEGVNENRHETTFDIRPELKPDVLGDAVHVSDYFPLKKFDLVLADPPYDTNHEKYGTEPFSKKAVIKECANIVKPGGYLAWLDTMMPMWAKKDGWVLKGTIGLCQSTNHKVRMVTILQRQIEDSGESNVSPILAESPYF